MLALLQLDLRGRSDSALAILKAALDRHPLESIAVSDRPYAMLIVLYARLGKLDTARRLDHEYRSQVPAGERRAADLRPLAEGTLAEAEGRTDAAAAAYGEWYAEGGDCTTCGLYALGRLADRAGRTDSALALYDRAVNTPTFRGLLIDPFQLAPALKRAGELYEAKGDRAKAAERYRRFVDLWKDADPVLQPGVRDVRLRLARLAPESPT